MEVEEVQTSTSGDLWVFPRPHRSPAERPSLTGASVVAASPTPPYGISVLECVRDSMVLAWKQPTFIGGADITGYFVDYREVIDGVPGKWHEANIRAISERAYRVSRGGKHTKKQVLNKIQEFVLLTADLNVRCRT